MCETSATIGALAAALAKAQAVMEGAAKDSVNPHFHSQYADLASVWAACRQPLAANGLAVSQFPAVEGARVTVTTLLAHASGEWLRGSVAAVARDEGPQAIGSVITYLRRYGLAAAVGVAPEDDDANAGEARPRGVPAEVHPVTGEERGPAPVGFHYIGAYQFTNGWHDITLLNYDTAGGSLRVSTKKDIGLTAEQAFHEGWPVKVKTSPKRPAKVGEAYLDALTVYKPKPELVRDEPVGEMLDESAIPF